MPRLPKDTVQITVRVPRAWLARADAALPSLTLPGATPNRADAFRAAIAVGLLELERRPGEWSMPAEPTPPPRRKART